MHFPTVPLALLSLFTTAFAIPLPDIETRQTRTARLTFYGANYKDFYYVDVPDGQSVKISTPTSPPCSIPNTYVFMAYHYPEEIFIRSMTLFPRSRISRNLDRKQTLTLADVAYL